MKICRVILEETGSVLAAVYDDEQVRPLRLLPEEGQTEGLPVISWDLLLTSAADRRLSEYIYELSDQTDPIGRLGELAAQGKLLTPLDRQEVWAAGVTYW